MFAIIFIRLRYAEFLHVGIGLGMSTARNLYILENLISVTALHAEEYSNALKKFYHLEKNLKGTI